MGSTTVDAKQHFGHRILELLGRAGLSQTEAARRAGMRLRTLQRWITQESPPNRTTSRLAIQRLEKVLGEKIVGTVADHEEGEGMIFEGERRYLFRDRGIGRSADFRREAYKKTELARHAVSRAIKRLQAGADPDDVIQMLEKADVEIAVAQRILMAQIELNEKGEPV